MIEKEELEKDLELSKYFLVSYERQLKRFEERKINPSLHLEEIKEMVLHQKEEVKKRIIQIEERIALLFKVKDL